MKKIYLAGFDVFYKDAKERFEKMRKLCKLAGYEALIPLDNDITEGLCISNRIYKANIAMIEQADGIIANLNAFRGKEPDSGTVFEVGYGVAKNKKIVGYTSIEDALHHKGEWCAE
jgi:nucleoside 2-deoxyribosyltransferase